MDDHLATAETEISATPAQVWTALTDPEQIQKYMFGTHVETDWRRGSQIVWKGEYEGRAYEDKGEIVEIEPERRLTVIHFNPP
ncbi:MAG: SRPBCC domain-containing protein [Acidimicrobiia bacterium]